MRHNTLKTHIRQEFLLLRLGSIAANLVDAQIRVRAVAKCNSGRSPREFLHDKAVVEVTRVCATVLHCETKQIKTFISCLTLFLKRKH